MNCPKCKNLPLLNEKAHRWSHLFCHNQTPNNVTLVSPFTFGAR